ncbi:MAG: polyprenyl synthetase family protein [Acidimicrobiia bacterium]
MQTVPTSLASIAARVDARLATLLDSERDRWTAVNPALSEPFSSLQTLLSTGKRLRPAFCLWGYVAAGGSPDDDMVTAAGAAFELLHAFALVHDDVMDGSDSRRGVRTTHLAFADRHTEGDWVGEARRFGEGVAILVGDLAFVYADAMLRDAPQAALDIWHELRIELNIGQYLDLLGTARRDRDRMVAERVARYKSGKYTVERPLHFGAALAAPARIGDLLGPLSSYGLPLGDAFQYRDDVLGVFGDSAKVGKPVGDDLREGKPTVLLSLTTERVGPSASTLLSRVGSPDLGPDEVSALQALIVDCGALDELESQITELTNEAIEAIERAPIDDAAREPLVELARYVAWRDK